MDVQMEPVIRLAVSRLVVSGMVVNRLAVIDLAIDGLIILWMFLLITAAIEDIRERKIKNRLNLLIGVVSCLTVVVVSCHVVPGGILRMMTEHMLSALLLSFPLFLANVIRPNSFGGGDIKLGFFGGWMLDFGEAFRAIEISFLTAALGTIGVWLISLRRHRENKSLTIPFGPFLAIGMILAELWL